MSTQRGNVSRKRPQKYKNRTTFKNDLHDKTPQQKKINTLNISEVCSRCKAVIEWKIKYKKYKPLTQAKTCTKCSQRNVLKAYHVICRSCALSALVCAKCLQSTQELVIEAAQLSPVEEIKLESEMKRLAKILPERKRRAFMRYMKRGKEIFIDDNNQKAALPKEKEDGNFEEDYPETNSHRVPYTRTELLSKLEDLKLSVNDNEDDDDDRGEFSDNIYYSDTDDADEQENEDEKNDKS